MRRPLSEREREVIELLRESDPVRTYAEIGALLGISTRTVGTLAQRAYRKLGVLNRWGDKPKRVRRKSL